MKNIYQIFGLLFLLIEFFGCTSDGDYSPLDIITQKEDLEQMYYKDKFTNPVKISGIITNKLTSEKLSGAKITARVNGTNTQYSTYSKDGGLYSLYLESSLKYIITTTKDGYDKRYYFNSSNSKDTVVSISYDESMPFAITVHDPTPLFTVNYISTRYLTYVPSDLSFNGTNLVGNYSYTVYQYDTNGLQVKSSSINYSENIIACQDTFYWLLNSSSDRTFDKMGQKGGKYITSLTVQVPLTSYNDVEVLNNNFWLLNGTQLYKLSLAGDQLLSINFSTSIADLSMISITKFNNYLYVLNKLNDNGSIYRYCIYKIDPATGQIISKGYLPVSLSGTLKGLAADATNFWTVDIYNNALVKLSVSE